MCPVFQLDWDRVVDETLRIALARSFLPDFFASICFIARLACILYLALGLSLYM